MKNYGRFKDMWRIVEGYLTPYFCKHHPQVKEDFGIAHKIWKEITTNLQLTFSEETCKKFDLCWAKMEKVLKTLESLMEEKRKLFPRLYFLSNDDLLPMLTSC